MTSIDLSGPPADHHYILRMERTERASELGVRLFKDVALFVVAVGFVAVIGWLCVEAIRSPDSSAEEEKWAMSVLSGAAGGIVGYLVRR